MPKHPLRRLLAKVVLLLSLSMAGLPVGGHEVRPSVADVTVGAEVVDLSIRMTLEPMLAGMNVSGLEDTNDSPLAARHDALRAEAPEALAAALTKAWPDLAAKFVVLAGETTVLPRLVEAQIPPVGNTDLPRDSVLVLQVDLPADGSMVRIGWSGDLGTLVVRQAGGDIDSYAALLSDGTLSDPLPREGLATDSAGAVFARYIVSGFEHIVPKGLDHILFVLGLFLFSRQMRPLLWQVTAFTLAHTVTLALASLGIVSVPAAIVEPLIAASIVYVAVENILGGKIGFWRVAVVFGFGLLHGLGFASVLGDVGLQEGRFVIGLIGFNIGVELGQLSVIAVGFALLAAPFGRRSWYRTGIVIPASGLIAAVGAWWAFERVFL